MRNFRMRRWRQLRTVVASCGLFALVAAGAPVAAAQPPSAVKMSAANSKLSDEAVEWVAKDPVRARSLMEQAAASGDPDALANLAAFTMQGIGKRPDPEGARRLLEQAVAGGSSVARASLALLLLKERDETGWRRAVDLLREAAEDPRVRPLTFYPMGLATLFGRGVAQDLKAGIDLLEACLKVDPQNHDALYQLGRAHQNGWAGRTRDPGVGAGYLKRSADGGDVRAMREYGMALLHGAGVAADPQAAKGLFRKAAEQGYRMAMVDLAVMLATGEGGRHKDPVAAREWYQKASALGSRHAISSLGYMLYVGEGGEVDQLTGRAYLELAAEAGDSRAVAFVQKMPQADPSSRTAVDKLKTAWSSAHPPLAAN